MLRTPADSFSYPDDFTLLTTQFERKPIYDAVRAFARGEPLPEHLWPPPPAAPSS
jgi:hypothetical protein